jgi:DNA integrity scanning protein DisA with diadenylate cyclase activity
MQLSDQIKNAIIGSIGLRSGDIGRDVRATASLAKVDGAIVITRDLQLLGFGAKIVVAGNATPRVCVFRPEPGSQDVIPAALEDLGGTRHQSAARFVDANKEAVALVISQDRHMSAMQWDESIHSVAVLRNAEWWI